MTTNGTNSHSKLKALLIVLATVSGLFFLACLVFHFTPLGMAEFLADYAAHHYFVFGFISLLFFVGCIRIYTALNEEIDRRYRLKHRTGRLQRTRRRWSSV